MIVTRLVAVLTVGLASAMTALPRSTALVKIVLGCPCAVTALLAGAGRLGQPTPLEVLRTRRADARLGGRDDFGVVLREEGRDHSAGLVNGLDQSCDLRRHH